jgi:hypothetical protein
MLLRRYHASTKDSLLLPGTFRPDRIKSIAERFGVDGTMALENILYGAISLDTFIIPWMMLGSTSACIQQ